MSPTALRAAGVRCVAGAMGVVAVLAAAELVVAPQLASWEWATLERLGVAAATVALMVGLGLWRRHVALGGVVLATWAAVLAASSLGLSVAWLGDDAGWWPFYDLRLSQTLADLAGLCAYAGGSLAVAGVLSRARARGAKASRRASRLGVGLLVAALAASLGESLASNAFQGALANALSVGGELLLGAGLITLARAMVRAHAEGEAHQAVVDAF